MRALHVTMLAAAFGIATTAVSAQTRGPVDNPGVSVDLRDQVRNTFVFVFSDAVASSDATGRANALARANGASVSHIYTTAIKGFAAQMPAEAAARMAAQNPQIAYFEPDGIVYAYGKPSSPGGGGGGGGKGKNNGGGTPTCSAQITPWGVSRVGGPFDGTGTVAWVIDTGIDLDHPDLNVSTKLSANFVSLEPSATADDGNGHGTHVAGTIAAKNDACDVVGVAAGASVVAVRVLNSQGNGSYSDVIAGVDYVAANAVPGEVANMSLSGPYYKPLNDAVEHAAAAGIYFTVAAGNLSADATGYSPASANGANIFTVSAIDSSDTFAWFSNYGPPVDCADPGVNVTSSKIGGGTLTESGTSMAAPHVAGLLLVGGLTASGTAKNDPDGSPDPICHH